MGKPGPDELRAARAEGTLRDRTEPRAVHAEYDAAKGMVLVQL
jgi:hypothetical protein